MTLYQVSTTEPSTVYNVKGQDLPLEFISSKNVETLICKDAGVDVYVTAPSAPGPRGRAFTYEDFTEEQLEELVGPAGTIEVGDVTTGEAGTEASIVNVGTDEHAILNFTIPKGDQGIQGLQGEVGPMGPQGPIGQAGPQGPRGEKGEKGLQGETGPRGPRGYQGEKGDRGDVGPAGTPGKNGKDGVSPSVRVGTVTTGQPGSQASVVNSGTTSNVILDFTIPCGADGQPGPAGQVQDVQVSYDQGQTWQSAMVGSTAKIITGTGGGGGGEMNTIEVIQKNGTNLPIVNKTVNVTVPTAVSQLTQDVGYALSSSLSTVAFSGSYNDLSNKPTIPAAQVQSDWNETDSSSKAYIRNKPTLVTPGIYGSEVGQNVVSAEYADSAKMAYEAILTNHVHLQGVYDATDLQAIQSVSGGPQVSSTGLLRRTGANTWTLDTTAYATASSVPTKTSDLTNDSGFITHAPIETISVNGVTQPIVNRNVDLTIGSGGGTIRTYDNVTRAPSDANVGELCIFRLHSNASGLHSIRLYGVDNQLWWALGYQNFAAHTLSSSAGVEVATINGQYDIAFLLIRVS